MITRLCALPSAPEPDSTGGRSRPAAAVCGAARDAGPTDPSAARSSRRGATLATAGISLVATLFLAACGGGGDGMAATPPPPPPPPPAPNEVPLSAAASVASWEAYAVSLAPSETALPLQLDRISTVPTSETDEPIAVP